MTLHLMEDFLLGFDPDLQLSSSIISDRMDLRRLSVLHGISMRLTMEHTLQSIFEREKLLCLKLLFACSHQPEILVLKL